MEMLCTHCREPRDGQSLCTLCNKWLCYQCTDMHQDHRTAGSLLQMDPGKRPTQTGSGCWSNGIPFCHFHKQEPLDLFCESCDLLSCSSCHLATHRDHRVVHVRKALQNQLWLFENLMVQVEDKKSTVENTAKQVEDRLHGVKIMQRKAENQIKMAKMIMINELNKRANLLIEQLEKVSGEFRLGLEEQLQGMIELCSQLSHVQNFISWASSHRQRNPLLFSKELITFQMQRLLESQVRYDLDPPVKIKFNWDASVWTKHISTFGELTAEGGSQSHSVGVACSSVLKPQPIPCSALKPQPMPCSALASSLCHRALDQSCSFRARCQPQMCCSHCVNVPVAPAPHPDLLVGSSRGSAGEHPGVSCRPTAASYPEMTLQPEMQPAAELDRKQSESSACTVACAQSGQPLPPQGRWDAQTPPPYSAHAPQTPPPHSTYVPQTPPPHSTYVPQTPPPHSAHAPQTPPPHSTYVPQTPPPNSAHVPQCPQTPPPHSAHAPQTLPPNSAHAPQTPPPNSAHLPQCPQTPPPHSAHARQTPSPHSADVPQCPQTPPPHSAHAPQTLPPHSAHMPQTPPPNSAHVPQCPQIQPPHSAHAPQTPPPHSAHVPQTPPLQSSHAPQTPPPQSSHMPQTPPRHSAHTPQTPPPHFTHTPQTPPPHSAHTPQTPPPHFAHTPLTPPPHSAHMPQTPSPHSAHVPQTPPPHSAHTTQTPPPHSTHTPQAQPPHFAHTPQTPPPHSAHTPRTLPPHSAHMPQTPPPNSAHVPQCPQTQPPHSAHAPQTPPPHSAHVPQTPPLQSSHAPQTPPPQSSHMPQTPPRHSAHTPQTPPPHFTHTPQTPPPHSAHTPQTPPPHFAHTPLTPPPHSAHMPQTPSPHSAHVPQTPPPHSAHTTQTPPPHSTHTPQTQPPHFAHMPQTPPPHSAHTPRTPSPHSAHVPQTPPPHSAHTPLTPPPHSAHVPQCPKPPAPAQAVSAGLLDERLRRSSGSPPTEPQLTQSSLQLLLQSPHRLQTDRLPGRRAQRDADPAHGWSGAEAHAGFQRSAAAKAAAWSGVAAGQRQTREPAPTQLQPRAPPALEGCSDRPAPAAPLPPLSSSGCRGPASEEAFPPNAPGVPSSLWGRGHSSQSSSEEPAAAAAALEVCPTLVTNRIAAAAQSAQDNNALAGERMEEEAETGGARQGTAQVMTSSPTPISSSPQPRSSCLHPCEAKPGKAYSCEDTGMTDRARLWISRKSRQDIRSAKEDPKALKLLKGPKLSKASRVPLVRLERLRFRLTPGHPAVTHPPLLCGLRPGGPLPEPPTEGAVAPEPPRSPTSEENHQKMGEPEDNAEVRIKASQLSSQADWPKARPPASRPTISSVGSSDPERDKPPEEKASLRPEPRSGLEPSLPPEPRSGLEPSLPLKLRSGLEPSLPPEPRSGLEPSLPPEPRSGLEPSLPPEPRSGLEPESGSEPQSELDPHLESEPDLYSEPELASEPMPESEPGLESEPLPESDSDMERERQPDPCPDPYREPHPGLESDADPEGDLEPAPVSASEPESESYRGPGVDVELGPAAESGLVPGPRSGPTSMQDHTDRPAAATTGSGAQEEAGHMENEDFCAVCRNGGDLLCCDHCPKVFHLSCHIPPLLSFPTGDWVCSLCRDVLQPEIEYDCENTRFVDHAGMGGTHGLVDCDQRRCEKLTLFISCNILSAPFHEPVSPLARHYYQIIKKPMDLSVIRSKLKRSSPSHYYNPQEFVADVFLMFRNCAKFNYPDSEVAQAGCSLEAFFSSKLREVFGGRTFPVPEDDSDSEEDEEFYRSGAAGFPWPDRKEHCHRKRKRRHSLTSRRHHI